MSKIEVSQLAIYPLKSAKGLSLHQLTLGAKGPNHDRRWMVVDENNRFLTQRQYPKMCLLETSIQHGTLNLSAPGFDTITVRETNNTSEVKVWNDAVDANDCGDHAAQWITAFLGIKSRLVYMPDSTSRLVDTNYAKQNETVGFADGFPLLLISEASLDNLNSKLTDTIKMERFRPNLVVKGCEPHAEDNWKTIKISGITFSLVKLCSRCVIPSIDPATSDKQPEILRTLMTYRKFDNAIYFGQNVIYKQTGTINVGDTVEVLDA